MAKSRIIKELAKNEIELVSVLKQLKLILVDLNKPELVKWVNSELQGYNEISEVPDYRCYTGNLRGTFLNYRVKCNNTPIVLRNDIPDEIKEYVEKVRFREGVNSLKQLQSSKGKITFSLPGNILPYIQKYAAVSMTYLVSAYIEISDIAITNILSNVENKVMDILIVLENEFGPLDDLDIDVQSIEKAKVDKMKNIIINIIYDKHIEIGDNNKIKDSTFND